MTLRANGSSFFNIVPSSPGFPADVVPKIILFGEITLPTAAPAVCSAKKTDLSQYAKIDDVNTAFNELATALGGL